MKPLIGVTPLYDRERNSLWMLPGYFDRVFAAGGIPVCLPLTENDSDLRNAAKAFDGFLLTGGQDVSPAFYGEERLPCTEETCPRRDTMERILTEEALRDRKPVFGICRGLQFMNAYFGGNLYQDLSMKREGAIRHRQDKPYETASHTVTVVKDTPLHACLGADVIGVNSCHHQGIRQLAPELCVMAFAPDGLVEAVCHPGYPFVWAVQWHPEMMAPSDVPSQRIFDAFVKACVFRP